MADRHDSSRTNETPDTCSTGIPPALNTTGEIKLNSQVPLSRFVAKHISPIPSTIYRLFQSVITDRKSGGVEWASNRRTEIPDNENSDEVIFANTFFMLHLEDPSDVEPPEDADDHSVHMRQKRQRKKTTGKGKKGKKSKKTRRNTDDSALDEIPLVDYRIIEDRDGEAPTYSDYFITAYTLFAQMIELRSLIQIIWRQVAYGQPPGKARSLIKITLHHLNPGAKEPRFIDDNDVCFGLKEQFLIYCYQDLQDFIVDFQKTRNVKKSALNGVEPTQSIGCTTWDLSIAAPFRRPWGFGDFPGLVTSLVMQKEGTNFLLRIPPYIVFQLQCIVDSITVSRGWSTSTFQGDILGQPAQDFRPNRDAELFMRRDGYDCGFGFQKAAIMLHVIWDEVSTLDYIYAEAGLIERFRSHLSQRFGYTTFTFGAFDSTAPRSRFSNTNKNGLWEYCPFICGVGLEDVLHDSSDLGVVTWDIRVEPTCAVHLYNMLANKGYTDNTNGLFALLTEHFSTEFFPRGKVLIADFGKSFLYNKHCGPASLNGDRPNRNRVRNRQSREARSITDFLNPVANQFFKIKTLLRLYREADWDPDRISEEDIPIPSYLAILRLSQAKHHIDPTSGKKFFEETPLPLYMTARSSGKCL
ncbi:uncharacterized protein PAC_12477 [Phialocephala subalpina]|uniref:DUF6604 domain-containing protein n=1 Tax=Phialocephala subalpina TaxID=576137 RepID=A0A1L7XBZ9_9HELO|nr:uncharacterized protein PAC_12477 [Phialocephala subalpina]